MKSVTRWLLASGLALAAVLPARAAHACGGFFCSATNQVNQSAERIIFARNADATVTAVIEIQYQGPAQSFSWLLPISSVPMGDDIAVASSVAFQRLQQATNPQYNLTTRVEGVCDQRMSPSSTGNFSNGGPSSAQVPGSADAGGKGVTVEASGVVGSFEWTVISLDAALADPADVAVEWLGQNGYDVPSGSPGLLGPYLEDGLFLLALKLQKGAEVGSIRPIVLTYAGDLPMIPIKLTAVAANEDMGVLTWLLGDAQAVPKNYNALELNEARINWFSANQTYNQVVTEAADDAGGQGFVTELAGSNSLVRDRVWSTFEEQEWQSLRDRGLAGDAVFAEVAGRYGQFDGFWEAAASHVTLPSGATLENLKACVYCYSDLSADPELVTAVEAGVIEPMRVVQNLLDAHPQLTRLYTTMSASEMTVDPLFTYNADLPDLSNIHQAERVIECAPGYYQEEAPWRIELPQGGVIRGGPSDVGLWPAPLATQPANHRILRQGESGAGRVLEDNSGEIGSALSDYNDSVPAPPRRATDGGSCSSSGKQPSGGLLLAGLGIAALAGRRRRRAA